MASLASLATINGDNAFYSYGAIPNNPNTWDANKVFGCYCDAGYTGYDCTLRTCPNGDDPSTVEQVDEQQVLTCTGTTGSVILTFRQQKTASISATATRADVKRALEALSTIDQVDVDFVSASTTTDSMCTSAGSQFIITFLTDHGNLPLITYSVTGTIVVRIEEYVSGSKEMIECSGRGICDRTLGTCTCFTGYGSSDGRGNMGAKGDCGYLQPVSVK
jgi:hypothetical protein